MFPLNVNSPSDVNSGVCVCILRQLDSSGNIWVYIHKLHLTNNIDFDYSAKIDYPLIEYLWWFWKMFNPDYLISFQTACSL